MKTSSQAAYPRINIQHDHISIDFGNGRRLTTSYGGQKATGAVPMAVFNAFCKMLNEEKSGIGFGDRVKAFACNIATSWPDWNVPPRTFTVGEVVTFDFGKRHGGMDKGVIAKRNPTTYEVRFERSGLNIMSGDMLASGSCGS